MGLGPTPCFLRTSYNFVQCSSPEEQHDPHQFDDAPENEIDQILDYINS